MKKYLLLFILLLYSVICISQKKEIIKKSIIKLEGKNTNIRNLLDIDGYYFKLECPSNNCVMFFEDGTWVTFGFKELITKKQIKENMSKSIITWKKNNQTQWGTYWGVYKMQNDTIIAYLYDKGSLLKGWSLIERRYKIIEKKIIKEIYYKGLLKSDTQSNPYINEVNLYFNSANILPTSDNWLKKNKWIWKNESDWKEYLEKVKIKKKK